MQLRQWPTWLVPVYSPHEWNIALAVDMMTRKFQELVALEALATGCAVVSLAAEFPYFVPVTFIALAALAVAAAISERT